jgi:hypothetical protein
VTKDIPFGQTRDFAPRHLCSARNRRGMTASAHAQARWIRADRGILRGHRTGPFCVVREPSSDATGGGFSLRRIIP